MRVLLKITERCYSCINHKEYVKPIKVCSIQDIPPLESSKKNICLLKKCEFRGK